MMKVAREGARIIEDIIDLRRMKTLDIGEKELTKEFDLAKKTKRVLYI